MNSSCKVVILPLVAYRTKFVIFDAVGGDTSCECEDLANPDIAGLGVSNIIFVGGTKKNIQELQWLN
jgi:hypothetical protein